MNSRIVVPALLAAAVIGTGVPGTLLYHESLAGAAAEANRAPATAAAKARIERILSYRSAAIGQDLAEAKAATTGEFGQQFATTADQVITPAAIQDQITTTATVVSTAVESADENSVVVLAFVDQTTTTKDKPQPSTTALRLRVTLDRAGGQWLVSHLAQV